MAVAVPSDSPSNRVLRRTVFEVQEDHNRRLDALERATPLRSASVGAGGITFYNESGDESGDGAGGLYFFLPDQEGFPGRIFAYELENGTRRLLRLQGPTTSTDSGTEDYARISIEGPSDTESARLFLYAIDGQVTVGGDGSVVFLDTINLFVEEDLVTTASAANMFMDSSTGRIMRSTSSERYKTDIEDAEIDPDEVLKIQPRVFRTVREVEQEEQDEFFTAPQHIGFIAEELEALPSLRQFVVYDKEGRPDAISYDRLSAALVALAQRQEARLAALEEAVKSLMKG